MSPARRISLAIPITVAGGQFMEGLDSTIIGTSLPEIARSLAVPATALSLALTSYLLSLAVFIPVSGWIADRFGARRVFCSAIAVFCLGSLLCGAAHGLATLIGARVVQGLGGAMMVPVARLILLRTYPKDQLIRALNLMLVPALTGPMLGPVVGGFITTYFSWRWIFFINLPVGLIGIVMTLLVVEEVTAPRPPAFDVRGFVLVGLGLAAAQVAIENCGRGTLPIAVEVALGLVAAASLLAYWRHAGLVPNPVIDLALFRLRSFEAAVLTGSLCRAGIGAMPFLLPLFFQLGFGLDPLRTGLLIFVASAGDIVMLAGTPRVLQRFGVRRVLIGNGLAVAAMLAGFALFTALPPAWFVMLYLFAFGLARSLQFSSLSAVGYADLTAAQMGQGSGITTVAMRLSFSVGIGIGATLLQRFVVAGSVTAADFRPVFLVTAAAVLAAVWGFRRLAPGDGAQLTGHAGGRRRLGGPAA